MCHYINRLVVEVEEAADAADPALQRPVAGEHVGVELEVLRHVPPVQQRHAGLCPRRRRLRARILLLARSRTLRRARLRPLTTLAITDLQGLFPLLRPFTVHFLNGHVEHLCTRIFVSHDSGASGENGKLRRVPIYRVSRPHGELL